MFDINHLAEYIASHVNVGFVEFLDERIQNVRINEQSDAVINISYGKTQSTSENDIITGSYSEINNDLLQFIQVVLHANYREHLMLWGQIYRALSGYRPDWPGQSIELNAFSFVDCIYAQENGRIISEFTWAFMFDRTWVGHLISQDNCGCSSNDNPQSLYNEYVQKPLEN